MLLLTPNQSVECNKNHRAVDLLEVERVTLNLGEEVVVDEAEETVDSVDDSVRRGGVGLEDSRLHAVVTHVHCSHMHTHARAMHSLTYLLTYLLTRMFIRFHRHWHVQKVDFWHEKES